MNADYLNLLLEFLRDDAVDYCKDSIHNKDANFWYHKGTSDAYQFILDKIKEEKQK